MRIRGDWPADASEFAQVQAVGWMFDVMQGRGEESRDLAAKLAAMPLLTYRRPPYRMDDANFDPQWVVFHENYSDGDFPQGGIAVGFADGHIEWIADEDQFDQLLNREDGR